MISIIITAYKEPRTIRRAIFSVISQEIKEKYELMVVAPDNETLNEAKQCSTLYNKEIRLIRDTGEGKPSALNLAFPQAKGEILILTDGDIFCSNCAELLKHFKNPKVGAVCGRILSQNSRKTMMGYWSQLLFDSAHALRKKRSINNQFLFCSGYLFAFRKNLIDKMPKNILDDAYISQVIWAKGFKIKYEENAKAFVKNPTNLKDWIKQKKRNAYGELQFKGYKTESMRSFKNEVGEGWFKILLYPKSLKEFFWTGYLFIVRLYAWIMAFIELNLKKKSMEKVWLRIESTK